jgi:MOSC domain-containing protein YiiM
MVEVSPQPHTGCMKFQKRFGPDALRLVNQRRELKLRGIYFQVVEAGEVAPGATIEVLSRG